MQAYILRAELAKFRRRGWDAYRHRKEYIEALFGSYRNGIAVVSMFYPFEHTATHCATYFKDDEYDELHETARENGFKMLGSIHTHPGLNSCSHPSRCDERHSLKTMDIISGVQHLFIHEGRKFAKVNFSCLWEPVEVKYVTTSGDITT